MSTTIQWTDETWNPIRARHKETGKLGWYCTKPSTGCKHCYAEAMNKWRGTGLPFVPASLGQIELFLDEKVLAKPLHWKKPRKIFVCDMTDLFQDDVPDTFISDVFIMMWAAKHHTFQILTKRPKRMLDWTTDWWAREQRKANPNVPYKNVWLGVSCEDQPTFDERANILSQTVAAVRFVSLEPLLGPITGISPSGTIWPYLNWAILGGESGPQARPCDLAWVRSLKEECQEWKVSVFVKQIGANPIWSADNYNGHGLPWSVKDKKGGDIREFPVDLQVREYPL